MQGPTRSAETIKAAVRQHYAEAARISLTADAACCDTAATDSSCCGTSATGSGCCGSAPTATGGCCDAESTTAEQGRGYTDADLAGVPAEAATNSWGCGNPVALASLQPGEVVLDLGSGGGFDLLIASPRVGDTGFVYGLDMTDDMLDLARRNLLKAGVQNAEVLKGDIEAIPLPDASVDVIISNCVINLTPDKGRVLREAWRVLRPGGRLAISDIVVDGDLAGLPVDEAQIRAALSWTGCIAGALTVEEYRAFLDEAGFEEIGVEIRHRYAVEEVLPAAPSDLAGLTQEALRELVHRFTSSAITARRPLAASA